jgi:hypothetical protein
MKKITQDKLVNAAITILANEPDGLKTSELTRGKLWPQFPTEGLAGAHGMLVDYARQSDAKIYQPKRGWFRLSRFKESAVTSDVAPNPPEKVTERIAEQEFYPAFAEWLVGEEECTKAIVVGGAAMRDRWGTPDVVGIVKPRLGDVYQHPIEIVSAEIKVASDGLITAFGQACAYKLFSHKSYIAIPKTASVDYGQA